MMMPIRNWLVPLWIGRSLSTAAAQRERGGIGPAPAAAFWYEDLEVSHCLSSMRIHVTQDSQPQSPNGDLGVPATREQCSMQSDVNG